MVVSYKNCSRHTDQRSLPPSTRVQQYDCTSRRHKGTWRHDRRRMWLASPDHWWHTVVMTSSAKHWHNMKDPCWWESQVLQPMKLTQTHFQHAQDPTEWHKWGTQLHQVYKSKHTVTQTTSQVLQHKSIRQIYFTVPPLTQQLMKFQVFRDMTPRQLVKSHTHFEGQLWPSRWRQEDPLKHRQLFTNWHCVISHKIWIFFNSYVRTPNLTRQLMLCINCIHVRYNIYVLSSYLHVSTLCLVIIRPHILFVCVCVCVHAHPS
jgi:hypothetical protein